MTGNELSGRIIAIDWLPAAPLMWQRRPPPLVSRLARRLGEALAACRRPRRPGVRSMRAIHMLCYGSGMTQRVLKRFDDVTGTSLQGLRAPGGLRDRATIIPKGRERVETILDAARHIIVLDGYGNFTMRKVAAKAGMSLGNLQHYFADKAALLRELLKYLNQRYDHDYATISKSGDPVEQLFSFIDYVLADGRKPLVRGLYWQFWALSSNDAYIFHCMERTYLHYREALAAVIKAVNPGLDKRELRLRSTLIQSMIEGSQFSLVVRNGELVPPRGLSERIRKEALRIAKRPLPRRRATASKIGS